MTNTEYYGDPYREVNEKAPIPTIIRFSVRPFCPACSGKLEMQEDVRTAHDGDTDEFLGFGLLCPWCGREMMLSEVAWREREKDD